MLKDFHMGASISWSTNIQFVNFSQGFDRSFPDLTTLIEHYAASEDGLPCKLLLAGSNLLCDDDDYMNTPFLDPDYQNLADFTSMLAELK